MQPLEPLSAPVTPTSALRRIATLMERQGAGSYRVEAFRKAAAAWEGLTSAEQEASLANRAVAELPGIGASTGAVITQASAGQLPTRLEIAQAQAGPLEVDGQDLYAAIVGDTHLHSNWSDGAAPIEEMLLTAVQLGQQWMVLTDHSPSLRIANGLSAERLQAQLHEVARLNEALGSAFTLLPGIEVDILEDGSLDQTPKMLAQLALVTASAHSKLRQPGASMTARLLRAVRSPRVNVLGHATGQLVGGSRGTRPASQFDAPTVFAACAQHQTAVEIDSRPERCDPPDALLMTAKEAGCLFAINSDSHAAGQLDMKAHGAARAARLGIEPARIITTWSTEDLTAWLSQAS